MTAKKGMVMSRQGIIGVCLALALVASAAFASNAFAKRQPLKPSVYVALGDSISFGFKEETALENEETNKQACEKDEGAACQPPGSFEPGFVGDFAKKLAKKEKEAGYRLTTINFGCPGETSGSMIGDGPLGSEIEDVREARGEPSLKLSPACGYENAQGLSLKAPLHGASQLEAALGILQGAADVTAVTISIGSNDEIGVLVDCNNPTCDAEHGFSGFLQCLETEVSPEGHLYPGSVFTHILTNIGVTIATLREDGHYDGPIVILGFYNPYAAILPGTNTLQEILNEHLDDAVSGGAYGQRVKIASIFSTFNPGGTKEEKAVCKYTEMCNAYDKEHTKEHAGDIHPTKKGYAVMGRAVLAAYEETLKEEI
jgi:lysophospholipase L1-like esterase